jgi:hypothetical protein
MQIKIHNSETGEVIERDMTPDELIEWEADQALVASQEAEIKARAEARKAVLDKLGLTADEVAALLGL